MLLLFIAYRLMAGLPGKDNSSAQYGCTIIGGDVFSVRNV
jgi:hypothetical protein